MFQNIQKDIQEQINEQSANTVKKPIKEILKGLFGLQNIALFVVSFMVSMVGIQSDNIVLSISPFAISFLAAMISNYKSIGIVYVLTLIGTFISFGTNSLLTYFLTTLVFFVLILIKRPKEIEDVNEQRRLGGHLFLSVFLVQAVPMFFSSFYVYDLLISVMLAILSYVFYKIFTNCIFMVEQFGTKRAFSIEEVIATSVLMAFCTCALKDVNIFGYSLRNILSILLILILGWKNGMLVGATGRHYCWYSNGYNR